jgi:hypothetical protein
MFRARYVTKVLLGLALAAGCQSSARAALATFTWNPAGASPALSLAGSAFTANGINATHYFYAVQPTSGPFPETFLERIQGFTLGSAPVSTPGLNGSPGAAGSYGLYLTLQASFEIIAGVNTFHSLDVSLIADPGNNNGTASSTTSGLSFSNTGATGAADDVTLATGSLSSASLALIAGTRNAHFLETIHAAAGETGFFVTPLTAFDLIEEFLTSPASVFTTAPGPGGSTIQMVNGGTALIDIQVPEPASLALLCSALGGLILARRRNT